MKETEHITNGSQSATEQTEGAKRSRQAELLQKIIALREFGTTEYVTSYEESLQLDELVRYLREYLKLRQSRRNIFLLAGLVGIFIAMSILLSRGCGLGLLS